MALTLTKTKSGVVGDQRYWMGVVAFDSSYPAGGEALAASDINEGWTQINHVMVDSGSAGVATKRVVWDESAETLVIFIENGASGIEAEAADASNQSGVVDVALTVYGF